MYISATGLRFFDFVRVSRYLRSTMKVIVILTLGAIAAVSQSEATIRTTVEDAFDKANVFVKKGLNIIERKDSQLKAAFSEGYNKTKKIVNSIASECEYL